MKAQFILFVIVLTISNLVAQNKTIIKFDNEGHVIKSFDFHDKSVNKKFNIQIDEKIERLNFHFNGKLIKGELTVKILDPNDKVEFTFILKGRKLKNNIDQITAKGDMIQDIKNPLIGKWKLIIETIDAKGNFKISIDK